MATLRLFLDLGDCFTKAIAIGAPGRWRLRFPSVVAHRLSTAAIPASDLVLGEPEVVPRHHDFDATRFPRSRSYPDAEILAQSASPVARPRFAGWLAAAYGADRELLGKHPSDENVDALLNKALLPCAAGHDRAELTFVVDLGPKVAPVLRQAARSPRPIELAAWRVGAQTPSHIRLDVSMSVVDAPACARAALPPEIVPADGPLLLVDIGYLRTKLAILSPVGCEHHEEVHGVGVAACVARILRDGQAQDLVEDELAIVRALERSTDFIEVQGRRFDVRETLQAVQREVALDIAREALRLIRDHYGLRGDACRAVAILGGGAVLLGRGVADGILDGGLGVQAPWIVPDPNPLLVEGASKIVR